MIEPAPNRDPQPNFDDLSPSLSQRLAAHRSGAAYDPEIEAAMKRVNHLREEKTDNQMSDEWKSGWKDKNLETFKNWMYLWLKNGDLRNPKKVEQLYQMHQGLIDKGAI